MDPLPNNNRNNLVAESNLERHVNVDGYKFSSSLCLIDHECFSQYPGYFDIFMCNFSIILLSLVARLALVMMKLLLRLVMNVDHCSLYYIMWGHTGQSSQVCRRCAFKPPSVPYGLES